MSSRVLFVSGWGRSGSTLLDRLLGQVDGTVSVGEMRDVWQRGVQENRLCGCGRPFLKCPMWSGVGQSAFGGWDALDLERVIALRQKVDRPWFVPFLLAPWLLTHRGRADLDQYVDVLATLYAGISAVNDGRIIIDSSKIPSYALILRRAGVDLKALHLVRDSRGVVHSWRKNVRRGDAADAEDYMPTYGVTSACVRYLMYNGMSHLLQLVRLPYLRLRYEDLVSDPVTQLSRLSAFVGIRPGAELLADLEQRRLTFATTHTVDGNPMRLNVGSIAITVDDGWRTGLSALPRLVTTVLTAPLLAVYGYLRGSGRPAQSRRELPA